MNRPPTFRIVVLGLVGLFVAVIGYQLASGSTRLLVTSGSSMEPVVESGDLIVVREQGSYAIDDLVAFQSAKLGTVLHRIVDTVERDGELRFVTQGDNNDFLDSDEPLESAILGTSALIPPNGGRFLSLVPILGAAMIAAY